MLQQMEKFKRIVRRCNLSLQIAIFAELDFFSSVDIFEYQTVWYLFFDVYMYVFISTLKCKMHMELSLYLFINSVSL